MKIKDIEELEKELNKKGIATRSQPALGWTRIRHYSRGKNTPTPKERSLYIKDSDL